jgi:N-carbamoylputrescine amidase
MSRKRMVKVGLIQHASPPGLAKEKIVDTTVEMIRDAAGKGAQVVATQELFASDYFCQTEDERNFELAEPIPGPTSQRLCDLAKELKVDITASLFEKRTHGIYHNTSIMISPSGEIIDRYRKMHIPDDPRFFEKYYFTPGDLGFRMQQLDKPGVKTGMLVCWDQWYPEAARLTAMRGAEILFYPTAIGWYHGETDFDRGQQKDAWKTIQRAHAIANGVFVVAINRIGVEGDLRFWGSSFVCDPGGVVLAEAPEDEPAVMVVDCDLSRIEEIRRGWPFFRDRRIDAYDNITKRFLD